MNHAKSFIIHSGQFSLVYVNWPVLWFEVGELNYSPANTSHQV